MYYYVEQAAAQLEQTGVSAEILDLRSLRPLDEEAIVTTAKKTNRVVIIEEGWPHAGMGAQIAYLLQQKAFDYLDAPVVRVTGLDVNMSYAANLENLIQPTQTRILDAVNQVLYRQEK